jgi:hypothetical protein
LLFQILNLYRYEVGCPRLRKLDLTQNVIGARGVAAVAEVLRGQALRSGTSGGGGNQRGFALEELSLRHNGCGDAGVAALAAAITEAAALARDNRRARSGVGGVGMGGVGGMGDDDSAPFSPAAGLLDDDRYKPHCLRALRLGFNGVTAVGAAALATALAAAREAARASLGDAAADAAVGLPLFTTLFFAVKTHSIHDSR